MAAQQRRLRALSRALPAPSRRLHPPAAGAPPLAAQAAPAVAGQPPPAADPDPTAMSDAEAVLFDCAGFLVIRQALSVQQVHALNAAIDAHRDDIGVMPQGTLDGSSDIDFHQGAELGSAAALSGTHGRGDFGGFLFEGEGGGWPAEHRQPFRELIAQPSTLRHLLTALGESTSAC